MSGRPIYIGGPIYLGGLAHSGKTPLRAALGAHPDVSLTRKTGLWDRFDATALEIPEGPVLLVDDIADSRWTLTVAARELRRAGASAVLPFTLALRA